MSHLYQYSVQTNRKQEFVNIDHLIIENGEPIFGTWQSVYFAEFDGPRERTVYLKIMAD